MACVSGGNDVNWLVLAAACCVRGVVSGGGGGGVVWVGGGRMSVRVGLWSVCNGWLLLDGARWYGVWVGGLLVVAGRSY